MMGSALVFMILTICTASATTLINNTDPTPDPSLSSSSQPPPATCVDIGIPCESGVLYSDPRNCSGYFVCDRDGTLLVRRTCSTGAFFDVKTRGCTAHEWTPGVCNNPARKWCNETTVTTTMSTKTTTPEGTQDPKGQGGGEFRS